ncbi:type VII secretion protein EccB [Streptomyces sp. RFCAC02]|uniref:type VII secretion protein EccB n=1 Tax=Streptomyces sp. RFCAC02 TaxID=2499143 RepID=UPI00101FACE5|nr:type VII secretion protein EccB [Streptomyces sp. RFCAC02]
MASTREQAEAYAYENRRRTTSLIRGADEARTDPRRRLNRGVGGGIAIGILIMAGFGIAGWLGGGQGPDLPDSGAVLADGRPYVVVDGVVHPALNLTSALLAGGGQQTEVRESVIDDAPRGLPVGIPGAPDAVPDADDLTTDPWTLCAVPSETGGEPTRTALYVSVPGIAPAEDAPSATVLGQTEDGRLWLLTEGRRYALEPGIRDLLGLGRVVPEQLPVWFVETLPEGNEITVPATGGGTGDAPAAHLPFDAVVDDVAHTELDGANPQYYLVRPDGLVNVSELEYTLLAANAPQTHTISTAEAARAPRSEERAFGEDQWPDAVPRADDPGRDQPVCVSTAPGSRAGDTPWQAALHLPDALPEPEGLEPVTATGGADIGELTQIWMPTGTGVLVRATTSSGEGGTYTLVTDSGTAFPLASPDAVERLGYDPQDALPLPRGYVGLLPTGVTLDPEAAGIEHTGAVAEDATAEGGDA